MIKPDVYDDYEAHLLPFNFHPIGFASFKRKILPHAEQISLSISYLESCRLFTIIIDE